MGCDQGLTDSTRSGFQDFVCVECAERYPESLLKACYDGDSYALKLRTGEVVLFETAFIRGDYVHLKLFYDESCIPWGEGSERHFSYLCSSGLDVRIDDIVWCADAPWGS